MAPGLNIFRYKRQAEEEQEEEEEDVTTVGTHIFGHKPKGVLHKGRLTTPSTTVFTEGKTFFLSLVTLEAVKMPRAQLLNYQTKNFTDEEESTAEPTESTGNKIKDKAIEVAGVIGEKTGIPTWGVVAIFFLIALIILGICGFCIRRCFRKRRSKDGKKGMKGVDLKSVQLLGSAYKEKVNIIMSMGVWLSRKKKTKKTKRL